MRAAFAQLDRSAAALLAALTRRRWLAILLILLVTLLAVLPGQRALPVIDRDEARFVQASRQMIETGNYIDPRNQDAPRYQKPVGLYWAQTAVALIDGRGADAPVAVFRLVSVVGIVLAALATWYAFRPLLGPGGAALAGLMTATAAVAIGEAHIAKTDALLLAVTTWAQAALVRSWLAAREGRRLAIRWLFWGMLAAGVLIKGPITLLVAGATLAGLMARDRSTALWHALSPWRGLLLFLALALPWFVVIGIVSEGAFFALSFGDDLLAKVGRGAEGHAGPVGYYLMTVWVSFWPWAPFALLALPALWRARRGPLAILVLVWILPLWITFEVTATKLPHYILPTLPAFAALAAWAVTAPLPPSWLRLPAAGLLGLGGTVLALLTALGPLYIDARPDLPAVGLAALGLGLTLGAALALALAQRMAAAVLALAAALLLMPTFTGRTLPQLPVLFPAERIAALDAQLDACAARPVASTGLTEMSLVVRGGTDTEFPDAEGAAALLARKQGARVFVTEADDRLTSQIATMLGTQPREIARFDTINYNQSERRLATRLLIHPDDMTLDACLP